MITKELFAARLKETRKEKKLTQKELGDRTGLAKSTICQFENGRNVPKIADAQKLAEALKISFDYLVGYSEYKFYINAKHISDVYLQLSDKSKQELYNYAEFLLKKEGD